MNNIAKYKFITYLFLLLSIFVLFTFSKSYYGHIIGNKDEKQILSNKLVEIEEEYESLSKIKSNIESGNIDVENFNKFLIDFSEDELVNYFYSYGVENSKKIKIDSVSFSEGNINEVGFREGTVTLNATFFKEQDMIDTINFLINSEKYNLYIHSFSYPIGDIDGEFSLSIPMKILYK